MTCFSLGGVFGADGAMMSEGEGPAGAIFGVGLLLTGLGLKAIHHLRERSGDYDLPRNVR
jgi:hypothetical protein